MSPRSNLLHLELNQCRAAQLARAALHLGIQLVDLLIRAHVAAEQGRLAALLGARGDAPIDGLRRRLAEGLRDGSLALDHPGLADHLRATVVNQLAIDQPRYSGLAAALAANDD